MGIEEEYRKEFREFLDNYNKGVTSGEDVGLLIARLAQYYCAANQTMALVSKVFNKKHAEIMDTVEDNLKPITAAKAKVIIDASQEAEMYTEAKTRLENIEQVINSLKYLQKGIIVEMNNSSMI